MHTWTARKPAVPGWYWTRRKIEDETSEYDYDVLRVEERCQDLRLSVQMTHSPFLWIMTPTRNTNGSGR